MRWNKIYITSFLSIICLTAFSQKPNKSGTVNKIATVNMAQERMDLDPSVLLITEAPKPGMGAFKASKLLVDKKRADFKGNPNSLPIKKAGASNPTFDQNIIGSFPNGTPNDNDVAVNDSGVIVSVINSNIRINRADGSLVRSRSLASFAGSLTTLTRTFDPRVIYDPWAKKFIVVFLNGSTSDNTTIVVGFSETENPDGDWNFYYLEGNYLNDTTWSDYPIISVNKNDLYITLNLLKDNTGWQDGFVQSIIWQVKKEEGFNGDQLKFNFFNDLKFQGRRTWSSCPVQPWQYYDGDDAWFLSVRPSDLSNDSMFLHTITGSVESGNASLSTRFIKCDNSYGLPPSAVQPGGQYLATNDARVLSAIYSNDIIQFAGNTINNSNMRPSIYHGWFQVNSNNANLNIINSNDFDFGYPDIAYAGGGATDNSSLITFSHSSSTIFSGTSVMYMNRNFEYSDIIRVKDGEQSVNVLTDTIERWGDYTGIQPKYNEPGIFWLAGSYGLSSHRTIISRIQTTDPSLSKPLQEPTLIRIYPNPSSDYFAVEFENLNAGTLKFILRDINGKEVFVIYEDWVKAGINKFSFRISDLQKGIYFLDIWDNKTHKSLKQEKLIIQ